jgi:hypothetical protein
VRLFRVRYYERVCRICGNEWRIACALADERPPGRRQMLGVERGIGAGSLPGLQKLVDMDPTRPRSTVDRRRALFDKLHRIDRNNRCPVCESRDFDQRKV